MYVNVCSVMGSSEKSPVQILSIQIQKTERFELNLANTLTIKTRKQTKFELVRGQKNLRWSSEVKSITSPFRPLASTCQVGRASIQLSGCDSSSSYSYRCFAWT